MTKIILRLTGFGVLFAILVSCCTPAPATTTTGKFPVKVVSGNVRIITTGNLKGDNSLNWSGLRFSRAILSGKQKTGESDAPVLGKGESITVEIIAIDGAAVVSASGKTYTLTKDTPRLRLIYAP